MSASLAAFERPRPGGSNTVRFLLLWFAWLLGKRVEMDAKLWKFCFVLFSIVKNLIWLASVGLKGMLSFLMLVPFKSQMV